MSFVRPPRLTITNLDYRPGAGDDADTLLEQGTTPYQIEAQFNPEELALGISAVYKDVTIPGMSHTLKQFTNAKNLSLRFDLAFHVHDPLPSLVQSVHGRAVENSDYFPRLSLRERRRVEGFLLSLCAPQGADTITRNRPPTVLVVWPQCLTFEGIVGSVELKYTRFNQDGAPISFTATVSMEELRDIRYTSTDARFMGLYRGSV